MHSNPEIYNELKELDSILAEIPNKNPFSVPEGYFDILTHDILLAINDNTVIESTKPGIPPGYFDGLADSIMSRIKNSVGDGELSPMLSELKNINVYRTPEGYFESLPSQVIQKIKVSEPEEETSPLLSSLKDIQVYTVPPKYFDEFAGTVLEKINKPAKIINFERRPSFFRYAAAAAITGLLGISLFSVFNNKETVNETNFGHLATTNTDLDKALNNISDNDIVNYLKQNGTDVDAALVASVSDEANLPDQVDYLTDDQTLDKLLDELKPKESTKN